MGRDQTRNPKVQEKGILIMRHYRMTVTVRVEAENPEHAVKKIRESLPTDSDMLSFSTPIQVRQEWVDVNPPGYNR